MYKKTGNDFLGKLVHVMCSADQAITERNSNKIRDNRIQSHPCVRISSVMIQSLKNSEAKLKR